MSSKTTNYNLHKIDLKDSPPDITVLNQNFDIIDRKLGELENLEYLKNINPTTTGHASLLSYMASRYDDHPVIYGYAKGFSDMPEGVTEAQCCINLCGGILTVSLYTLADIYFRRTNNLTRWTTDWGKVPDASNFLPLSGGNLTGKTLGLYNGKAIIEYYDDEYEGVWIAVGNELNNRGIVIPAPDTPLQYGIALSDMVNGNYVSHFLHGDHTSPWGSYTGNGSTTKREINIGGTSWTTIVNGWGGFALINHHGAAVFTQNGVTFLDRSEANTVGGVLTLATKNEVLNRSGNTVWYQCV